VSFLSLHRIALLRATLLVSQKRGRARNANVDSDDSMLDSDDGFSGSSFSDSRSASPVKKGRATKAKAPAKAPAKKAPAKGKALPVFRGETDEEEEEEDSRATPAATTSRASALLG
jgi:double-strand break repair protein MRE11